LLSSELKTLDLLMKSSKGAPGVEH
jgi:hypothetical protein